MEKISYFGRLFAFIAALTALSTSCGKAEAPEPSACWKCQFSTRIGPIPAFTRDTTVCDLTEAQARQFEQDNADTLITYRESSDGSPMCVEYITEVECTLKPATP